MLATESGSTERAERSKKRSASNECLQHTFSWRNKNMWILALIWGYELVSRIGSQHALLCLAIGQKIDILLMGH